MQDRGNSLSFTPTSEGPSNRCSELVMPSTARATSPATRDQLSKSFKSTPLQSQQEKEKERRRKRKKRKTRSSTENGKRSKGESRSPSPEETEPTKTPALPSSSGDTVELPREKVDIKLGHCQLNSSPIKSNSPVKLRSPPRPANLDAHHRKRKSVLFSDNLVSDLPSTPEKCSTPKRSILKTHDLMNPVPGLAHPNSSSSRSRSGSTNSWSLDSTQTKPQCFSPKDPGFWSQGIVIQVRANAPELPLLVEGCISVLAESSFTNRFEVYATLNGICKTNSNETLISLFSKKRERKCEMEINDSPIRAHIPNCQQVSMVSEFVELTMRDLQNMEKKIFIVDKEAMAMDKDKEKEKLSPVKNDPFVVRGINQALKFFGHMLSIAELASGIPIEALEWILRHSSEMLTHPRMSKTLVSPYLTLIKDFNFDPARKRALFENHDLVEQILFGVVNMTPFPSLSLIAERFSCLRNYIICFPQCMAKHFGHWFEALIISLCNITSPMYSKCLSNGVQCLLEASKTFLDNIPIQNYVRKLLSMPPPSRSSSSQSLSLFTAGTIYADADADSNRAASQNVRLIDIMLFQLNELISAGQYQMAVEIWMGMTMLVGNAGTPFEKWTYLGEWLQIPRCCYNSQNRIAKILAINCWKAVVFNICKNELLEIRKELDQAARQSSPMANKKKNKMMMPVTANSALRPKLRLLTHVFQTLDVSQMDQEYVDALHQLFLRILYLILSPSIIKSSRYLHTLWVKVIQFVLAHFYFRKSASSAYMNQLGLQVLTRLITQVKCNNTHGFNELRVLASEEVDIGQISAIPSRWIHANFDVVMQNLILAAQSAGLSLESKVSFFRVFINAIRPVVQREDKPSATTYDIIDNLPTVLRETFAKGKPTYEIVYKIVLNLNDTFNPSDMVNVDIQDQSSDTHLDVYTTILQLSIGAMSKCEQEEILTLISRALNSQTRLVFVHDALRMPNLSDESQGLLVTLLNLHSAKKIDTGATSLDLYGGICAVIRSNYELLIKRVIQAVVSSSAEDSLYENLLRLKIDAWDLPKLDYTLLLLKDGLSKSIQRFVNHAAMLRLRLRLGVDDTVGVLKFLTQHDFSRTLLSLQTPILELIESLSGPQRTEACLVLKEYLVYKCRQGNKDDAYIDAMKCGCSKKMKGMDLEPKHAAKLTRTNGEIEKRQSCVNCSSNGEDDTSQKVSNQVLGFPLSIPPYVYTDIGSSIGDKIDANCKDDNGASLVSQSSGMEEDFGEGNSQCSLQCNFTPASSIYMEEPDHKEEKQHGESQQSQLSETESIKSVERAPSNGSANINISQVDTLTLTVTPSVPQLDQVSTASTNPNQKNCSELQSFSSLECPDSSADTSGSADLSTVTEVKNVGALTDADVKIRGRKRPRAEAVDEDRNAKLLKVSTPTCVF
ncbi:uncharacterized protein LODBEIA_P26710 [Lodderomyces beijingensis]|uniref:Telomere-associated protein Rif1 N-terminal domain-containing protein n=1 Tax=Lodderomyces beijingensis TaxID=1775926 RepID=A0ABP0ZQH1_9ASCO